MSLLSTAKPVSETRKLKALFFGPPGSGKTRLAGTAPKAIFLDTEGGTMSIRGTGVDVLSIDTWDKFALAVQELMLEKHNYESVVVDSVTMLQEVAGNQAKLLEYILSPKDDARQAYGAIGAMVRHKLLQLNALPMNVIFTAQLREKEAVDMEAGQYPLIPDVTPAIYKVLTAIPDVIGRTHLTQTGAQPTDVEYRVTFGPETRSPAKQRDLHLPNVVTNLTIPKLIEMIGA
jgi:phage nucleotide-binding protein